MIGPLFAGRLDEAADAVIAQAMSGRGGYACLANAHVVVMAHRSPELRQAIEGSWTVFPDGWPVAWLQRRLGSAKATRIAGPDLMPIVVERGQELGLRHFLFGSTHDVVDRLEAELKTRYRNTKVVGRLAPPDGDLDVSMDAEAVKKMIQAHPNIVWCGLGAPRQERWMQAHARALAPALLIGVGAAFDFVSGAKPRAPVVLQNVGLEWLCRLAHEPLRLGPRYVDTNTAFLVLAARTLAAKRRASSSRPASRAKR